jgi:hypothetical protein
MQDHTLYRLNRQYGPTLYHSGRRLLRHSKTGAARVFPGSRPDVPESTVFIYVNGRVVKGGSNQLGYLDDSF